MQAILSAFTTGFALSAALIIAIGAQNLFVLRQGLKGEHVGPIVIFFGLSDALLIIAGVSGVGTLLAAVPQLTLIFTIGGAVFLGWYGILAFRRMVTPADMVVQQGAEIPLGKALAMGAAFTFLNPHVYLDTVLLMGTAASAQPDDVRLVFAIGATCASFTWFAVLGYGARMLQPLFTRPPAWRVLDGIVGVVMFAIAASLTFSAFNQAA